MYRRITFPAEYLPFWYIMLFLFDLGLSMLLQSQAQLFHICLSIYLLILNVTFCDLEQYRAYFLIWCSLARKEDVLYTWTWLCCDQVVESDVIVIGHLDLFSIILSPQLTKRMFQLLVRDEFWTHNWSFELICVWCRSYYQLEDLIEKIGKTRKNLINHTVGLVMLAVASTRFSFFVLL